MKSSAVNEGAPPIAGQDVRGEHHVRHLFDDDGTDERARYVVLPRE